MVNNRKPLNKQAFTEHDLAAESRQALESESQQRVVKPATRPKPHLRMAAVVTLLPPSLGHHWTQMLNMTSRASAPRNQEIASSPLPGGVECGTCFTDSLLIQSLMCRCLIRDQVSVCVLGARDAGETSLGLSYDDKAISKI